MGVAAVLLGTQAAPNRWSTRLMRLERGCGGLPQPGRRCTARRLASRRRSSAKAAERVRPVGEAGQAVGDAGAGVSIAIVVLTGTDGDAAMWVHWREVMGGSR